MRRPYRRRRTPISFSSEQLSSVMAAAKSLTPKARHSFLLRVALHVKLHGTSYVDNAALSRAIDLALQDIAA